MSSKKHCPSSAGEQPVNCATSSLLLTNESRSCWPKDVGIIAMEVYFPSQYVDQSELELFDGVSQGKYTIGLGQSRMGFCSDREDINSLCLTVLTRLVENTGIGYKSIGRLEVGTETIIDKSKSVKSALMTVLAAAGNTDVEGVDTTNACYGGTAALLNSVNWVESSAWDGRYAVAVAGDIAVYATGAARPTGGAGAVAMLVGPNAPLVIDAGVRSSYMNHSYDFYKPDLSSEYPTVDGKLSIQCYFSALDACYNGYLRKAGSSLGVSGLDSVDAVLFHTPYCKLVQKSLARLAFNDFLNASTEEVSQKFRGLESFRSKTLEGTYFDRDVEKSFMAASSEAFSIKTKPSLLLASQVGNMYTPSLYGGLASLLASYSSSPVDMIGKRVCLFSYGSGLASTMFSITVKKGRPPVAAPGATAAASTVSSGLEELIASLSSLTERLTSRCKVSPQEFADVMMIREKTHHLAPYSPSGPVSELAPGTWYLESIDAQHRRHYGQQPQPASSNGTDDTAWSGDAQMLSPKKAAAAPDVEATPAAAAASPTLLMNG